jgi:hypothetical protein
MLDLLWRWEDKEAVKRFANRHHAFQLQAKIRQPRIVSVEVNTQDVILR